MPVSLYRKVKFNNEDFTPFFEKEYLFGPIGSKITANIMVTVEWAAEDVSFQFSSTDNTITRLDGGSFILGGFVDGDSLVVTGTASNNFSYVAGSLVVTDSVLYLTGGVTTEGPVTATIRGTTPIVAIDFYPNIIENNSSFNLFHLTDRETVPRYSADSISLFAGTPTLMQIYSNSHGWVSPAESVIDGTTSATIYKDTTLSTTTEQIFVIEHTFTITPLFLSNQLDLLKRGNPPAAGTLKDRNCLKYIFTIDAKFDPFNADVPHTSDGNIEFPKGQTGWYNEFINGRQTVYTKRFISYYAIKPDDLLPSEITAIDFCEPTTVTLGILSPYLFNSSTKFIVHLMYLPINESEYINTRTDYKTNFIYERAVVTNNGTVVQGENTGDYHFIKNVSANYIDTANAQIDFTVEFSNTLINIFDDKQENNRDYLIFVTTDRGTEGYYHTTLSSLIIDVNQYQCDKDDPTLFRVIDEWGFLTYPYCNGVEFSNLNVFPRDTIVAKGQFYVKQGNADFPVILKKISTNIVVTNSTNSFPLETFSIDTSNVIPNFDNVQLINFEQDRDFIIPFQDCRNTIRLMRMPTLDITGYNAYEFIYPFKVRWEEWRRLDGADRRFSFPTQNWQVYANQPDWSLKFTVNASVEYNDYTTDFEIITWGTIKDPCAISYSVDFETFDVTGGHDFETVIAIDQDTFVKTSIYGDFTNYTADELYGILHLDAWGVGGIAYSQEIGTIIPVDEDFVWYGANDTRVATLTKISNSRMELTAYLDYKFLPKDTDQFILAVTIREYVTDTSNSCDTLVNVSVVFTCGEFEIIEVGDADTIIISGIVDSDGVRDRWVEGLVLVRVTDSSWNVTGGTIDGEEIISGSVSGVMDSSPTHPYNNSLVGEYMHGEISGTVYLVETVCGEEEDFRSFNDGKQHLFNDFSVMDFNT